MKKRTRCDICGKRLRKIYFIEDLGVCSTCYRRYGHNIGEIPPYKQGKHFSSKIFRDFWTYSHEKLLNKVFTHTDRIRNKIEARYYYNKRKEKKSNTDNERKSLS